MGRRKMNWLTAAAAALILIGLPALSWYYLKKGADWRRAGLAEMSDKRPITGADVKLLSANGDTIQLEEGVFAIASNLALSGPENQMILNKIAEQFNHQPDLLFLYFGDISGDLAEEWTILDCQRSSCEELVAQFFKEGMNTVLIDDSLNIRVLYDVTSEGQTNKLAEHGAILFPVEKRKEIELKRGANQ